MAVAGGEDPRESCRVLCLFSISKNLATQNSTSVKIYGCFAGLCDFSSLAVEFRARLGSQNVHFCSVCGTQPLTPSLALPYFCITAGCREVWLTVGGKLPRLCPALTRAPLPQ